MLPKRRLRSAAGPMGLFVLLGAFPSAWTFSLLYSTVKIQDDNKKLNVSPLVPSKKRKWTMLCLLVNSDNRNNLWSLVKSSERHKNIDAYKCLLGMCGLAHLFIPGGNCFPPDTFPPATGKVFWEVCGGKQGRLKVFAYVSLLCAWMSLSWRWILAALRVRTPQRQPAHKINRDRSQITTRWHSGVVLSEKQGGRS